MQFSPQQNFYALNLKIKAKGIYLAFSKSLSTTDCYRNFVKF